MRALNIRVIFEQGFVRSHSTYENGFQCGPILRTKIQPSFSVTKSKGGKETTKAERIIPLYKKKVWHAFFNSIRQRRYRCATYRAKQRRLMSQRPSKKEWHTSNEGVSKHPSRGLRRSPCWLSMNRKHVHPWHIFVFRQTLPSVSNDSLSKANHTLEQ